MKPGRLEAHVAELGHQHLERHAVLERHRREDADRVHQAGDGAALLGHLDEDLARRAVLVEADVDVALVTGDIELVAERAAIGGQPAPHRLAATARLGGRRPARAYRLAPC